MNSSNAAFDQAEQLAEAEREAGIVSARAALSGGGFTHCVNCGVAIPLSRRKALPSAKRCFECQQAYELDQVMM